LKVEIENQFQYQHSIGWHRQRSIDRLRTMYRAYCMPASDMDGASTTLEYCDHFGE